MKEEPLTIEQFYRDYFEDIAARHPEIKHNPEGDAHFWELVDIDRLSDLNKVMGNILILPALILRPFTDETSNEYDNPVQQLSGAFTVLLKVENNNWDQIRQVRRQARQIAQTILARMRADARPTKGCLYMQKIHLLPKFPGSDEPVVAGQATGWTYEFDWRLPLNLGTPDW